MIGKRTFLKGLFASPAIIKETASQIEGALKSTQFAMDEDIKIPSTEYYDTPPESTIGQIDPWWKTELELLNFLEKENPDWQRRKLTQSAKNSLGLRMDPNVLALRSVSDSAKVQITINNYVKNHYKREKEYLEVEKSRDSWEQLFREKIFGKKY